ncbi:MAG TPA: DUF2938 domain-containing protein [Steroidobacter sp.]|uniref:DUF2938 domain-containing protein n=1 Tax=Steroidobacter sp. TaxID=1978227 RepID=UPI002EDB8016
MSDVLSIVFIGVGATIVMDVWGVARKMFLGIPPLDYAMVGRWIGHMTHGQFRHDRIAAASPIVGERALGWNVHYLTGIAFAGGFVWIVGHEWLRHPTLSPALAFGVGTVLVPFLLMQPCMGLGVAASRAPRPVSARLQSFITHGIFGFGLWAAGWATRCLG